MVDLEDKLKKILSQKDIGELITTKKGESLNNIIKKEGKRFQRILQKHINAYYDSYYPTVYHRTHAMQSSLRIETDITNLSIGVYFDDTAWHMPTVGSSQYLRFVPTLIDTGWEWKNAPHPIYRFTYWDGAHFIKEAIDEFYQNNPYNLTISVESYFNTEYYRKL